MKRNDIDEEVIDIDENTVDTEPTEQMEEFIDTDEEGNEKNLSQKNKELREKIKKLEQEKKEYLDGWQRAKADAINKEKSYQEDRKSLITLANKKLLTEIIPVMDSFMAAMANKDAWEAVDQNWRIGVEYIKSQLQTVFENHKLIVYGQTGDEANPNLYNTLETIETEDKQQDHTVAQVLQYGYMLDGVVIREAKCKTFIYKEN